MYSTFLKSALTLLIVFEVSQSYSQKTKIDQKIDSLNEVLSSSKGLHKIDVLIELGAELTQVNIDSSLATFRLAKKLAHQSKDKKREALSKVKLATAFNYKTQYDSAHAYFIEAEADGQSLNDYEILSSIFMNRGITYFYQSDFSKARELFTKSLNMASIEKNAKDKARCYNNIGLTFQYQGNFEDAFTYLLKSTVIEDSLGNELAVAKSYNNMAMLLSDLNNYDEAKNYYEKSLQIKLKHGDQRGATGTYINLAILYKNTNSYDESMHAYLEALKLAKASNYTNGMLDILSNLAVLHNHLLQHNEAIQYLEQALTLTNQNEENNRSVMVKVNLCDSYRLAGHLTKAKKMAPELIKNLALLGNTRQVHQAYLIFSQLYEELNLYSKSLTYYKKHKVLGDSIFNQEKNKSILELKTQYETEKKEKEIELLSVENELKETEIQVANNRLMAAIGTSGLLLLTIFLLFNRYKHKQRALLAEEKAINQKLGFKSLIEGEEKERKRIAQELHDGLGQLLSTARLNISALEDMVKTEVDKQWQNSLKLIDDAVTEVRHISHNMMPNALISIGFEAALKEQIHIINDAGQVKVHCELPKEKINFEESEAIALYRVIQEVLNNSLKYSAAQNIWVIIANTNGIEVSIKDDGKGFDTNQIKSTSGIGWQNIESRIELLNGELNIQTGKGAGCEVNIKLAV
ncbi:Signal transduction histidine kinase [Reichenbachiella faecimaris]|uniref:histidine kinase n=1 Tax=Reichenbachiella faecimaris TaxID=692418 RepID=A0A1W2G8Q1_REIFA|nr:sensor histidine kinase [Reichenbachiella faecimaris]SMD33047.1 Signal transduction histidine kinase [Reichenbachiella faecimaris]